MNVYTEWKRLHSWSQKSTDGARLLSPGRTIRIKWPTADSKILKGRKLTNYIWKFAQIERAGKKSLSVRLQSGGYLEIEALSDFQLLIEAEPATA